MPAYVHYYYGKALHDRTEHRRREDSEKLEEAWQRYLDGGAPIGHRGEVRAYLAQARR